MTLAIRQEAHDGSWVVEDTAGDRHDPLGDFPTEAAARLFMQDYAAWLAKEPKAIFGTVNYTRWMLARPTDMNPRYR